MNNDENKIFLKSIPIDEVDCVFRNGSRNSISSELNISIKQDAVRTALDDSPTRSLTRSYSRWSPSEEGVTLAWRDLSVYAHTRGTGRSYAYKKIITNVTGAVRSGSMVALMGSSGAGKSTLMSALAFRTPGGTVVEGDILINGRPIGDYMRSLSGFMHQEDLFVGSLTVLEHLNIMARLKLDRYVPNHVRKRKVKDLLNNLGLTHCMHTRIGISGDEKVLSGGEKKRLAFATELLTNPPLLFCDEPTTGLDSFSAQKLVQMMNVMAAQGKTIVVTIHQPSSELFAMFNQILLVADGRIAFTGTTEAAIKFFKSQGYECPANYNPADFFIRTLALTPGSEDASKYAVRKICDHFAVSDAAKELDLVVQYEFHMGATLDQTSFEHLEKHFNAEFWWVKLMWLTYRCVLQVIRDPSVQFLRIFQKIAIAVMAGLCYLGTTVLSQSGIQSVQGALFIFVSENTFSPMYSTLSLFPQELPLFLREYRSGLYNTSLYYISKMIAVLPGLILEPTIFVAICYWMVGLRSTLFAFSMTVFTTVLTMNVSTACGMFFSTAFESVPIAMAYLVPFDYVLMITSGLFIKLSTLPDYVAWVRYLSWLMYSNEAMTIVQWNGVQNITCESQSPDFPCLLNGEEVLEKYSFSSDNLWKDLISMMVLYSVFHILGFVCLLQRARKR